MSNLAVVGRRRQTLEHWINEAMTDTDKDGKLSRLSLVHRVGQQEFEVHSSAQFGSGKVIIAKDLANMFQAKAESYAQDLNGVQTFNLLAFYGEVGEPQARHPFIVNTHVEFGGLASEGPTKEGQIMQDMRQREMLFQQVYARQARMDDYTLRMIQEQGNTIVKLVRENMDAFDVVKEMMIEKTKKDHEHTMEVLKMERSTKERAKWLSMAPALVNTVLGREVFPQGTVDTALVEGVMDSLEEKDIATLAGVLKPEILAPLMDRWTKAQQARLKARQEIERALPAHTDPEKDAGGGHE